MRSGGVTVPIGGGLPADEIVRVLEDCGARLLVADRSVLGGTLAGRTPPVDECVVVDGGDEGGAQGFARLLAAASEEEPAAPVEDSELALIFYTSGTTGRAKGVMLTHGNLMFATRNTLRMTALMGPMMIIGSQAATIGLKPK